MPRVCDKSLPCISQISTRCNAAVDIAYQKGGDTIKPISHKDQRAIQKLVAIADRINADIATIIYDSKKGANATVSTNSQLLKNIKHSDIETADALDRAGDAQTATLIRQVEHTFETKLNSIHAKRFPQGIAIHDYDFSIEYLDTVARIHVDTGVFLIESDIDYATL